MSLYDHIKQRLWEVRTLKVRDQNGNLDPVKSKVILFFLNQIRKGRELGNGVTVNDIVFSQDEDFNVYDNFQRDLEREMDEIAERCINAKPRTMDLMDIGSPFERIGLTMENVDSNGLVKKQIITRGVGPQPSPFSRVIVHYDFFKEGCDEPFDSTYLRGKPCKLRLDEHEIIAGLEIAIKSMKKKETAKFLIKWQVAFGHHGCPPRIPRECDVLAYVTLVDFTLIVNPNDDVEFRNGEAKLNSFGRLLKDAKHFHCEGNDDFACGRYKAAIKSYRKCIGMLNEARLSSEDDESRMNDLKVKCLVNLSICFNKTHKPQQAIVVSKQALILDPKNVKAMYQYGKSNSVLMNLDVAEKWLKKACYLKPDDDDISRELNLLLQKKEKAKIEENLFCKKAFSFCSPEKDQENKE